MIKRLKAAQTLYAFEIVLRTSMGFLPLVKPYKPSFPIAKQPPTVVVCSPEKEWRSGDYCVVVTEEGEALVKKIHDQDDHLILSSIAPGYDPIMLPKQRVRAVHKIVWKKER